MAIKRSKGLDHSAVGVWNIKQKVSLSKSTPIVIGFIYDGSIGRSKKIIRGMLLKTDNEMAYLLTKDKTEVKVCKNTLKIVC